jgi:hypothetical protein
VAYRAQPRGSRPAGIGGRFRVLRPGGQIAVSDSDYNILTITISSAGPLQSCVQAFVATDVNDLESRAGAAMLAPAGFTCP